MVSLWLRRWSTFSLTPASVTCLISAANRKLTRCRLTLSVTRCYKSSYRCKTCGGAVAQLGARLDGIEEVEGSNPFGSTYLQKSPWKELQAKNGVDSPYSP